MNRTPTDRVERDLRGEMIAGRYRIERLLGEGAMGAVYRADDVVRGRPLAVKLLRSHLSAIPEAGARFQREGLVSTKLAHPNCVSVSDFGTADNGQFYLAMELIDGESLGDIIDRDGRLPWRRALRITRHILRGLDHAHRADVVHRDIKPDNIFIVRTDQDQDFAKILDFGIAKLIGDSAQSAITQSGITIGTPKYLSPEQAVGGSLDGRSDLYSTSIVLYEMLTGKTPFGDREPLKTLMAHATAPVPAFADVAPEAQLPPEVEALVRDGLAKRPEDRIATAGEYIRRIDALLGPEHRPRSVVRWVAAAVAVAALAVGAFAWFTREPSPQPTRAPQPVAAAASPSLETLLRDLDQGKTCADRRATIAQVRALGDPAAIPALEKARSRLRRGKNTNACLVADVDAAIADLSAR